MNERTQELSSLTNITGLYQLKKFSNIGYQTALAWFNQGANYMPKFTAGAYGYPHTSGQVRNHSKSYHKLVHFGQDRLVVYKGKYIYWKDNSHILWNIFQQCWCSTVYR